MRTTERMERAERVRDALRRFADADDVEIDDGPEGTVAWWVGGNDRLCSAAAWAATGAAPLVGIEVSVLDGTGVAVLQAVLAAWEGERS